MKTLLRLTLSLALLLSLAGAAAAQTALTATTLSAAIADGQTQTMTIASATGWTATTSQTQTYAVIDREVVGVRTVSGTQIGLTRGLSPGIRATGHASGAKVYFLSAAAVAAALTTFDRAGSCSTSGSADYSQNGSFVPVINPQTGNSFYCTSGGVWLPVTTLMGSNTCTVTQATSKATGVTCSAMSGTITLNGAALAAAAEVGFTVTNTMVAAGDVVILSIKSGATAASYTLTVDATAAGSFAVGLGNQSAGSLSEAVVVTFAVIKVG
jgi:hypothetical protein